MTKKNESIGGISLEKKKKILGIFLCLFSVLLSLSILSYSRADRANSDSFTDLFKVFSTDPAVVGKIAGTSNWLGVFGAYISDGLINATLGYFAIAFPIVMLVWGYAVIINRRYRLAVYLSNFILSSAILLATLFGVLRFQLKIFPDVNELSGKVGGFFGSSLGRLMGGIGSLSLIAVLLFVELFIVFDFSLESIINFFKENARKLFAGKEKPAKAEEIQQEKPKDNLRKIKELKKKNSIPSLLKQKNEAFEQIPDTEEEKSQATRIRIIRKDRSEPKPEKKDDSIKLLGDLPEETETQEAVPLLQNRPINDNDSSLPDPWNEKIKYTAPPLDLLEDDKEGQVQIKEDELNNKANLLRDKLRSFEIDIKDISVIPGPVVTLYEIIPAQDVKISKIVGLGDDIALALAAKGIRIIAPIPGKGAIGVEIPNANPSTVRAKSVIAKLKNSKAELPIAMGKGISGDVYITDLAKMPHMLIAGATGSGKSVGINMMLTSLIYSKHPSEVKFVIIDPKKIELSFYQSLDRHFLAVSPDIDEEIITSPQNALLVLKSVEYEMEKRYDKLAKAGVRSIIDYNAKIADPKRRPKDTESMKHFKMPYIVVVIDELADLMMTSGKEVEAPIARIAQLARAVGIHLLVATQRPSVNVITGVIKANFPARVAYQVATKIDSRTILDMNGAQTLIGMGDMLFLPGGLPKPVRIQNAFISTAEVEKVTNFIRVQTGYSKRYLLPSIVEKQQAQSAGKMSELDPVFREAAMVFINTSGASVSMLQRRLKLGYARAARVVDQLESARIIGPADGSKLREVYVNDEDELDEIMRSM